MKKAILIIICLAGILSQSKAQTSNWIWAKGVGYLNYDYGKTVAVDASGNSYYAGDHCDTIKFDATHVYPGAGAGDIFIVKYGPTGNVLWAKSVGGTKDETATAIALDASGNLFVTGYFKSPTLTFGTITLTNAGGINQYDMFLAKLDANGNYLWAKMVGSDKDDKAYGLTTDASGNCFVTGYFTSASLSFGGTLLTNTGATDVFIAKFSSDGSVLWAKSGSGQGSDFAKAITVDNLGNAYIVGDFGGYALTFGSKVLSPHSNRDIFAVKFTAAGNVSWARQAGITGDHEPFGVGVDNTGYLYIDGSFKGPITFGTTKLVSAGHSDIFVVKYDTTGAVLWAKSTGGILEDVAKAIALDNSGNIYIAGFFKSASVTFGTTTLTNAGTQTGDMFITKYDTNGNVIWAKSAGSSADENISGIAADSQNFYVTGNFGNPPLVLGATSLKCKGTTDAFFAKSAK